MAIGQHLNAAGRGRRGVRLIGNSRRERSQLDTPIGVAKPKDGRGQLVQMALRKK
ncbi:hypothetical protein [Microcoleus sp. herbarium14]|uniref:hypothetical protein n=1 Tax=Microcoleus sp. herbarium14 TaxID=3055439 RepID=UPI002FD30896